MDVLGFHLPNFAIPFIKEKPLPKQLPIPRPYENQWGIYDEDGFKTFDVDSCNAVDYSNKVTVSKFPVEDGAFISFNKVSSPYDAKVKVVVTGQDRIAQFLSDIEDELSSTHLYNVVTPEKTYTKATIDKYNYKREHKGGQHILIVTIDLVQVRVVSPQYTNTAIVKPKKASATPKADKAVKQPEAASEFSVGGVSLKDLSFSDILKKGFHAGRGKG